MKMRLGINELMDLIDCIDMIATDNPTKSIETSLRKLGLKLSKELKIRGHTSMLSRQFLNSEKK